MAKNKHFTEVELLENYRVALTNAVNQPEIAANLSEYGYSTETIATGNALLEAANTAYSDNKTEDSETRAARLAFEAKQDQIEDTYRMQRKKAKILFRKSPVQLEQLGLTGAIPDSYASWVEKINNFYTVADHSPVIQETLARLNLTAQEIKTGLEDIKELRNLRTTYLQEKGESQGATKAKDAAFKEIDDWMSDFFAVARIAMEDNPQLLESLGIFVRS